MEIDINRFYIVDEIECPCEEHICYEFEDGYLDYIHPRLQGWGRMGKKDYSSKIVDYGISIAVEYSEEDGITNILFTQKKDSSVKYSSTPYTEDSNTRYWQGEKTFKLFMPTLNKVRNDNENMEP